MTTRLPVTLFREGRQWSVGVEGPLMWTEWGVTGGKLQRSERRYAGGKQGRTAAEQAEFEAEASVRKKLRAGFAAAPAPGAPPEADAPLPMLATDWAKVRRPERLLTGFWLQPKLDGIRCVADTATGRLFSRTGKPLLGLPHIEAAVRLGSEVAAPPARWLDGEVYRHGATFQGIVGAARRTVNMDARAAGQLQLHLFDAVDDAPTEVRLRQLASWFEAARALVSPGKLEALQPVHTEEAPPCASVEEVRAAIDDAVQRFVAQGYEGAIARVGGAPYTVRKRSLDLVKAKRFLQEEFAVIGLEERAKQPGVVATVRCRTGAGDEFGATPECTHGEKMDMWRDRQRYTDGRWVATVRFQELTDAGIPRFPVCSGLRHPEDC